ncbi:hypothetical protein GcM3_027046 [Golovinomyces cichoracearum]|uniref:DUF659 domain-containing protein n=1 Tax=Golovinomyces cichoracearum TaxID=62708 RepID=A0A420J608_9PEZI|nr:hypothetical protein GcM3_027046 [Golovinomyces cichoracearum]
MAKEITKGALSSCTSLTSDTFLTKLKFWKLLQDNPIIKHDLSIHCDSHGTQLFLKDLMEPGLKILRKKTVTRISTFFHAFPNMLVAYFSNSHG